MTTKVEHVRRQIQRTDRTTHTCHWPGCDRMVPPAAWGCRQHWFMLPKVLRDRIWAVYEIGQEASLTPSDEYLAAAHEVQDWIAKHHPPVTL